MGYVFFFSIRTKIRACSPLETSIYILREFFFIFFFFLQQTIYELFEMVDSIFYIYICHDTTRSRCIGNTSRQLIAAIADAYFSLDCYPTPSQLKRILCLLQIAK